ncbi:TPA: hypothetical protein HA278_06665 [Candidatus Woesearchaeota archaeon]|nr:hypothetical protein [Candidatus Woesearchaeota archaeon]
MAKERLSKINSSINIETHAIHVNKDNINVLEKADLIIDCTDNLSTRFLLNDYCRKNNKIWIYGAAIRTSGYVMPIFPDGPCLQCFIEEASLDTCDTVGVLNAITTSIGALQVSVGMKVLLRKYEARNDLYYYDIWNPTLKKLKVTKKENCPTCNGNYEYLTKDDSMIPIKFCGKGKYQIQGKKKEFGEMKAKWSSLGEVIDDGETLRFKNMLLFKDGRVLITADTEEDARSMYSKYVGD